MAGAMPQNHAQSLRERKPLSRRARWLWGLSGVAVIVAVVVLVLVANGPRARAGCIDTTLPGVIGAQSFDQCGAEAHRTCATVTQSRREFGSAGVGIIADACRRGHIPVG